MKITAIPFMIGTIVTGFFMGDFSFAIDSALILTILYFTKQVELI